MDKEMIIQLLSQKVLRLEEENFRVDSTRWNQFTINKQGIVYLKNSEGDIWEYVDGVPSVVVGQQLFNWPAAMRETRKVGKRMPTDEEFGQFKRGDFGQIVFSGTRVVDGSFEGLMKHARFWSSSAFRSNAWYCRLHFSNMRVRRYANSQLCGFSVRCLKS